MNKKDDILLISDLHLSPARPDITAAFYNFLATRAIHANRLMILGDFFEMWLGDDMADSLALEVAARLKTLSESGTIIEFMQGNRDFSIGQDYADLCGMQLLPEFYVLHAQILLCHGDQLCTLDTGYQRWRKFIRHPLTLWILRHSPKKFRALLGKKARLKSLGRQEKQRKLLQGISKQQTKNDLKYDVVEKSVTAVLTQYNAKILIHGHTHKPFDHKNRYVLSDWDRTGDYLCLCFQEHGFEISRHPIQIVGMD